MKVVVFDCEVFAHDWLFVFKEAHGDYLCISHNNNDEVRLFMSREDICLCGFNNKHYDNFILKAVLKGSTPEEIKDLNDFIIDGDNWGGNHPLMKKNYTKFANFDLMHDTQKGTSLKSIEAHLGMDIEETEVDFDIDRSLTAEELAQTIHYCKHDVEATERLLDLRQPYLKTKINLGARANMDAPKSLSMTNAQITAAILQAKPTKRNDGRNYVYPANLDLTVIPKEILDFVEQIHDLSIPDKVLFDKKLEINIGGTPCVFSWGGFHGSKTQYYEATTEDRLLFNRDVKSLYPSLIELYHYLSRNVANPSLYYDMRRERLEAKARGDKQTASDLKFPLNGVSGATDKPENPLYDPLQARSMRISGQLFIVELAMKLLAACKTIVLFNLNTDAIAYSIDKSETALADKICDEWQKRTGLEFDTDYILRVWIKDVNNLLIEKTDGKIKTVGAYLNYGISTKGAWSINNKYTIVKDALREYLLHGTPLEKTIYNCNDVLKFQIIAKAGGDFKSVYQIVNGQAVVVQRCNRVYATQNEQFGTLFKVHKITGATRQIESLPPHCVIDNKNTITIQEIDKSWYVKLAQKYVDDFTGGQDAHTQLSIFNLEDYKMATKKAPEEQPVQVATTEETKSTIDWEAIKAMSIYEKLMYSRLEFTSCNVKKTGKHTKPDYLYFTLQDIVPPAQEIFAKYRCVFLVTFTSDTATGTLVNLDKDNDNIVITSPIKEISPVINSQGKPITNAMQDLGSTETFSRRYLYLAILDIVEHDDFDGENDDEELPVGILPTPQATHKAPATVAERKEIVGNLTNADGKATPEQLEALKTACMKWRDADANCDEQIQEIALNTNGFTETTKETCEALLIYIGEQIELAKTPKAPVAKAVEPLIPINEDPDDMLF